MSSAVIKINGKIDKLFRIEENGPAILLFKGENGPTLDLKSVIIMVEVSKRQWRPFKDHPDLLELYFTCIGKFELRKKQEKPYLYVKSVSFKRLRAKGQKAKVEELEKIDKKYDEEIELEKKELEELKQNEDKFWFKKIEETKFKEVNINKVKLVEKIHLNSRVSIFNIRNMSKCEELTPIAVRENEKGEYELVTGLRSFIIGKLFSINTKAYITDLDRKTFKQKYSLEK